VPDIHWALLGNEQTNPAKDFLGTTDARPLIVKTHAAEAMRVDDRGNVGIGTQVPEGMLHVSSGTDFNAPQLVIAQTTPQDFARLRFIASGIDPDSGPRRLPLWDIAAGRGVLNFFVQGIGNVMTLAPGRSPASGALGARVGVGTEQPQTTLDVRGVASVEVLEITGGADVAEPFRIDDASPVDPGTVLVIDEQHAGCLKVSDLVYDRRVAGIVSGGGGVRPGLTLQDGRSGAAGASVALAGRVYCKAEALSNPIAPGDLLTTSAVRGHAMKAVDREASHGAILGKSMSELRDGTGLVLVLVNLH
jgi:hypothetical protein